MIAVFSVLLLLAVAGAARTRFDAGVESVGLANSEVREVERVVEAKFGRKGEPLFLVARADNAARLAEDFDLLDRRGERWRRSGVVGTFSSPSLLLPPPHRQKESRSLLSGRRPARPVRRSRTRKSGPERDGAAGNGAG